MKTLYFTTLIALSLFPCRLSAEDTNPILKRTAEALASALSKLDPKAEIAFTNKGSTLIMTYLPHSYKIHSRSKAGEISKVPHDEIGPSSEGFILRSSIENQGAAHQADTPLTLVGPFWKTDINVTLVNGTDSQLFWSLCYGSRTDSEVLSVIRTTLDKSK